MFIKTTKLLGGNVSMPIENYIVVSGNKTEVNNALELQAAYDLAKTKTPYGQALSSTNRFTIVIAPGTYSFNGAFILDTPFIDIVSLTGNRDVIFDRSDLVDPFEYDGITFEITEIGECLLVSADNIFVKGIEGKLKQSNNWNNFWGIGADYILPIQITNNLPNIKLEKCKGTDFTFSNSGNASGTFERCIAGLNSFGSTLTGVLYYCRLTSGTFTTVSGGGRTYYCVDGNGNVNNQ